MATQATLEHELESATKRDEAKQRLVHAVEALATDEGFRSWLRLRTSTSLGRYSIFNQLLIADQMKEATRVAGYRAWQREGRQVKKGAKALWVFAPIKRTWNESDEEGNLKTFVHVDGFTVVPVFDLSQTVGPELPSYSISPTGSTMDKGQWLTRLQVHAMSQGIMVEVGDANGAEGYYNPRENIIRLSDKLDTDGMVHCLVHELVHAAGVGYKDFGRATAEVVTELAADIVLAQIGLDTTRESSLYVLAWSDGDQGKVLDALKTADEVAKRLEDGLGLHKQRTPSAAA
jgi:hypothetical protein